MSDNEGPESGIIPYQTEDGRTRVDVRFDEYRLSRDAEGEDGAE